jgi:hypothetical protein
MEKGSMALRPQVSLSLPLSLMTSKRALSYYLIEVYHISLSCQGKRFLHKDIYTNKL